MFEILPGNTICVTRGDVACLIVSAHLQDGKLHSFSKGDEIRFKVFKKNECDKVVLQKDITVSEPCDSVAINLTKEDTSLGGLYSRPIEYWYEVEVNPDTAPQTIIGYDETGPRVLRIYPEGGVNGA